MAEKKMSGGRIMELPQDANILLSYVNLKLRDFYSSLDAMCEDLDESTVMHDITHTCIG